MAPCHVKPYVKRGRKNDAADAAAICEAVTRPHMRFVPAKSAASQAVLVLHRTRDLLVIGATGLIRYRRSTVPGGVDWVAGLLARKPVRLVTVALANSLAANATCSREWPNARIAWAILRHGWVYRQAAGTPAA